MSDLKPNPTVQKVLISTTSRLIGEYQTEDVVVSHAWPDFYKGAINTRITEGPASRSSYVVAFRTEPVEKGRVALPDYSPTGDLICTYLSILYGKRFDNHGLLEGTGFYKVPEMSAFGSFCQHKLPHNNHNPRKDLEIPLNLVELNRIEKLLEGDIDSKFHHFLLTAGQFYSQALQNFERYPEFAYLNLITTGEVLSNYYNYSKTELLDDDASAILSEIALSSINGPKLVKQIKSRLFQVKRRFVKTITNLINDNFFTTTESELEFATLKKNELENRVSAAYDLRSRYVHTGVPFGGWVSLNPQGQNNEIQIGKPVVEDSQLGNLLALAPTLCGLERIIRYCLLRFIHTNGILLDCRLDPSDIAIGRDEKQELYADDAQHHAGAVKPHSI